MSRTIPTPIQAGVPPVAAAPVEAPAAVSGRRLTPKWDPLRLLLGLLVVVVISRVHQHFGIVAKLRPALLLAVGALVYAMLNRKYLAANSVLKSPLPRVVLALLVVACLSVPFGISIGNSGRMILFSYSKLIIIVILTMLAIRTVPELFALIWSYVIGAGILAFFATFIFTLDQGGSLARLNDLYTWDANDAGLIFVSAIPLALLLAQASRGVWRTLAIAAVPLMAVAVIRTGSRGAFLGLLALGLGLLFLAKAVSVPKRIGIVVAALLAFLVFAPADYRTQMRGLLTPKEDYNWTSAQGRKEVSKRGMGYMWHGPFGVGIDNFGKAECSPLSWFYVARGVKGGVKCSAPHNTWVQAGAETGFPGLVLWSAMILGALGSALKSARRVPKAWHRGDAEQRFLALCGGYLATAIFAFAISSTFVSFAWQEFGYLLTAYAVGLAGLVRARGVGGGNGRRLRRGTAAPVAS